MPEVFLSGTGDRFKEPSTGLYTRGNNSPSKGLDGIIFGEHFKQQRFEGLVLNWF
ncbi:MAG TPA: hypothetical protein V6D27_15085 [Vampirovibrionales bacterium]